MSLVPDVVAEDLTLVAADGYPLSAKRFRPAGDVAARLVVANATAVPQGYYRRFALHAAARGVEVLTLDYRGIGASAPPHLRGFRGTFKDWARLDLAAAVAAQETDDDVPLFVVGHSWGGIAVGLLPDPSPVDAVYAFGSGSGWHGYMPRSERIRVRFMWGVVAPAVAPRFGYLPWSRIGGVDVPYGVYRQWRRWTGYPRFFFDDPREPDVQDLFDRVRAPIAAATSVDDRWVTPRSRDALFAAYRNADVARVDLVPADLGLTTLGHMGYFRPQAVRLWDDALDWLFAATR